MDATQSRVKHLKIAAYEALQQRKFGKAFNLATEVLDIYFEDAAGLYLTGVALREDGHPGAAAHFFRRCVAMNPEQTNAWLHFGACLHDVHEYDSAIQAFQYAKNLAPGDAAPCANIAASHAQKGEFIEAVNWADQALEMNPSNGIAHVARAFGMLGLGRWEGFDDYKWLYGRTITIREYTPTGKDPLPEWKGEVGKIVVVQGDQGVGDEIMFSSVLPDLAKHCTVIYDCHPKLESLFRRSFPNVHVYGDRKDREVLWLDAYSPDARIHISGLPEYYRKNGFPRNPYLTPNPELQVKWLEKLKDLPKPWVGIAWQGGSTGTMRDHRSVSLADWVPVIERGGTFVDLSYHDSSEEVEKFNENRACQVERFDVDQNDYDDTMALISVLDVVISVATAVTDACGAIGKPCLMMLPSIPSWKWGTDWKEHPWYESVKFFRQAKEDPTFEETISRIADEYTKIVESCYTSTSE